MDSPIYDLDDLDVHLGDDNHPTEQGPIVQYHMSCGYLPWDLSSVCVHLTYDLSMSDIHVATTHILSYCHFAAAFL